MTSNQVSLEFTPKCTKALGPVLLVSILLLVPAISLAFLPRSYASGVGVGPSIQVTPNSGPIGTQVTVTGTGFSASTQYSLCFSSSATTCPAYDPPYSLYVVTDSSGNIPAGTMVQVPPSSPAGSYYVVVLYYNCNAPNPPCASAPFTVPPESYLTSVAVQTSPIYGAYSSSTHEVYVTNDVSNDVSVIANETVVATIPVQTNPWGIAYDSTNKMVYVVNGGSGTLSVINDKNKVAKTVTLPVSTNYYYSIAYDPLNNYLYITATNSTSGGNVLVLRATTDKEVDMLAVGSFPAYGIAYDPSDQDMYVTNNCPFETDTCASISVLSSAKIPTVVGTIPLGCCNLQPWGIIYNPPNGEMYVALYGSVDEILGLNIVNSVAFPGNANQLSDLTYDATDSNVWVTAENSGPLGAVYLLSQTNAVVITFTSNTDPSISAPIGIVYDAQNTWVYVANAGQSDTVPGTVSIFTS